MTFTGDDGSCENVSGKKAVINGRMERMEKVFFIGTRSSPLALVQVREVLGALKKIAPGLQTKVITINTIGDRDKKTPISEMEGTDFFTRDIDEALIHKKIDFAVHSAKDLPDVIPEGIVVATITKSVNPYDVLVSRKNLKLRELPKGARVGTSSERRKNQLRAYRPDLTIVDIRGTMQERLDKMESENLDAIVIAGAGLNRLGLGGHIAEQISFDILKPHPLQGSLAVTVRKGDKDLLKILSRLNGKKIASYDAYGKKKRILVTGTGVERFKQMGEIVHVPMIEIKPVSNFRLMDAAIKKLDHYDGLIFTSKHAVRYFLERAEKKLKTVKTVKDKTLIAIGKTTAKELAEFGLRATKVPEDESAEGIIKMADKSLLKGKRFLIPRSNLAQNRIAEAFGKWGARVDAVTAYRNVKAKAKKVDFDQIDEIVFTSPSTVRNFFETYHSIPEGVNVKAIGPVTKAR